MVIFVGDFKISSASVWLSFRFAESKDFFRLIYIGKSRCNVGRLLACLTGAVAAGESIYVRGVGRARVQSPHMWSGRKGCMSGRAMVTTIMHEL